MARQLRESGNIVKTLIFINVIKINRFDSLNSNLTASLVCKKWISRFSNFLTRSRAENIELNELFLHYDSPNLELIENQGNNKVIIDKFRAFKVCIHFCLSLYIPS